MRKTLICFPPKYRELAQKLRENYNMYLIGMVVVTKVRKKDDQKN